MNKKFLILLIGMIVCAGTLFSQSIVLFENGQWNPALGTVTVRGMNDNDRFDESVLKFENGVYTTTLGLRVDFERFIDASFFRFLTIETEENIREMGHWVGGAIFIYHPTAFTHNVRTPNADPSPTHIAQYGFWDMGVDRGIIQSREGNIRFELNSRRVMREVVGSGSRFNSPALTNFVGFRVKKAPLPAGSITIKRITLHS